MSCCFIPCPNKAEFDIHGGSGQPEDHTQACEAHVGALLGTPSWLETENTYWSVTDLRAAITEQEKENG